MPTAAQDELLRALRESDPRVRVTWNPESTLVTHLSGDLTGPAEHAEEPATIAREFLAKNGALLGIEDPGHALGDPTSRTDAFGWHHITFPQTVDNVPVWGSVVRVHVSRAGTVRSISSAFRVGARVDTHPAVPAETAVTQAAKQVGLEAQTRPVRAPRLSVYVYQGRPHLAWVFKLRGWGRGLDEGTRIPAAWLSFVDAHDATVIAQFNQLDSHVVATGSGTAVDGGAKTFPVTHTHGPDMYRLQDSTRDIDVYDASGDIPDWFGVIAGALSEDPDNNWNDTTGLTSTDHAQRIQCQCAEVDAIDHLVRTRDYFSTAFGRNSLDNAGLTIKAYAHVRTLDDSGNTIAYNNAYWDGDNEQIVFGDGQYDGIDGDYGDATFFSAALDIVAHEYTHGVTYFEIRDAFGDPSGFIYSGESGATSEAFSDIFAAFVDGDWRQGDAIVVLGPGQTLWSPGKMWRDLSDPTRGLAYDPNDTVDAFLAKGVPQPDHYDIRYQGAADHGGVHINNSILTYACYLATHGGVSHRAGRTPEDVRVYRQDRQGIGAAHAEQIFYHALTSYFNGSTGSGDNQDATFAEFRQAVLDACDQMAVDHQHGVDECDWKTLNTAFYAVGLHPAGDTYGPDPMITPWGDRTGSGPRYQTPDIWVEAPGGAHVNAEKGTVNTLVARVHNIGDEPASDVKIAFSYSPFGFGYHHDDFQHIGDQTVTLAAGESRTVSVSWDLTDLADDFGGVWPRPIGDFDHFCVRVRITSDHDDDVNTCNNMAQHNFVDVPTHAGANLETLLVIANSDREMDAKVELHLHASLPRGWKVLLDGATVPRGLLLRGNEKRAAKLGVRIPRVPVIAEPLDGTVVAEFAGRPGYRIEARLEDSKFHARSARFKGTLQGSLSKKARLVATVSGRVLDLKTGDFEGSLVGTAYKDGRPVPVRGRIRGRLTPERRVSLGASINGIDVGGVEVNLVPWVRTVRIP